MRELVKNIVNITHVISLLMLISVGAIGVIYELVGHAKFEKIFDSIGMPNAFQTLWLLGVIALGLLLLTYLIKTKFL